MHGFLQQHKICCLWWYQPWEIMKIGDKNATLIQEKQRRRDLRLSFQVFNGEEKKLSDNETQKYALETNGKEAKAT